MIFLLIPPRWNSTEICSENKGGCGIRAEIKEARKRGNRPFAGRRRKRNLGMGHATGKGDILWYGRVGATFNSLENICVRNVKCVKKKRGKEREREGGTGRGEVWRGKWNNEMTNYDKFSNKCAGEEGKWGGPLETSSLAPEMGRRTCQVACQAVPPPRTLPASPHSPAAFILSHAAAAALGARLHLASFNDAPNVSHVLIAIAYVLLPLCPSLPPLPASSSTWKMQSGQSI